VLRLRLFVYRFFFSSRRRHTRFSRDWSSDVCSSDLVEVKTGGYSAEFGRSTGGVVNTVTKSGTNDFMVGLHANWAPDSLREQSRSEERRVGQECRRRWRPDHYW